jgi:threonine synthase
VLLLKQELASRTGRLRKLFDLTVTDMWKYAPLLPVDVPNGIVTLGEGGTPLIRSHHLAEKMGLASLVLKNETTNPTGSFKDRQVAVGMHKALDLGKDTVTVISSGNVAASAAALAARLGLSCLVFVPSAAPDGKLIQAGICGARVFKVRTRSSSLIMELVEAACERTGWLHLSTAGSKNPFTVEGAKTIAYEIYEQGGGRFPTRCSSPSGAGAFWAASGAASWISWSWAWFTARRGLSACSRRAAPPSWRGSGVT